MGASGSRSLLQAEPQPRGLFRQNIGAGEQEDQLGHAGHLHLFHDVRLVDLDGAHAESEGGGDLAAFGMLGGDKVELREHAFFQKIENAGL